MRGGRRFSTVFIALVAGAVLSASSVWATAPEQLSGYLMGDLAPGKLVPFYRAESALATIIGIENLEEDGFGGGAGKDITVHVTVFTKSGDHVVDFDLCLSPFDFGFLVLQKNAPSAAQQAELAQRFAKVRVLSTAGDGIPGEGYATLRALAEFNSHDGTCGKFKDDEIEEFIPDGISEPLATWAILQDVGKGFFASEIPTLTAIVEGDGEAVEKAEVGKTTIGAYGLIPEENRVFARFDVNPNIASKTEIFVWLSKKLCRPEEEEVCLLETPAFLNCEDEFRGSTLIDLGKGVNIIDPDTIAGQCKALGQYRGVLEFTMPAAGFLWSHISQEGEHFQETFLGYNLDCNIFIDPSCDGAN